MLGWIETKWRASRGRVSERVVARRLVVAVGHGSETADAAAESPAGFDVHVQIWRPSKKNKGEGKEAEKRKRQAPSAGQVL